MIPIESFPQEFQKYARQYAAWSQTAQHKRRVDFSRQLIHEAMALERRNYIAFSGGKDSTVMTHLIKQDYPDMEMWSYKDIFHITGSKQYMIDLAEKYNWGTIVFVGPNDQEAIDIVAITKVNICDTMGPTFRLNQIFCECVAAQEKKFDGVFMGLRKEESRARTLNYAKRGAMYQRKDGFWVCNPLSLWKAEDVFAYFLENEIPIFEIYTKCLFTDPGRIRVDWYLPGNLARHGCNQWLKYYYPEVFYRLAQIAPEVQSYV